MTSIPDSTGPAPLRRLAQISILFAVATALATVATLMLLPYAGALGYGIVIAAGAALTLVAFAFGVLLTVRKPLARRIGFAVIAALVLNAVLFGLLSVAVPESAWLFGTWALVLVAYALLTTHRLVRWPTDDFWDQEKSSLAIFISYRHQDSRETVGRIHDHLRKAFEDENLFQDVESEVAGDDYRIAIGRALERADVVLAVIGTRWLTVTDSGGRRRLDDPGDMVRLELETAFARQLRVIPVLIEGASMPGAADVPPSLQMLCYRIAMPVRPDPDFTPDMRRLVTALREEHAPADAAIAAGGTKRQPTASGSS
jgi:hypothetical protein